MSDVSYSWRRGRGNGGEDEERTARGLKAMNKALREATAELGKERDLRKSLIDSTRANFLTDPFAKPDSVWAGGGDPNANLLSDIANLREFRTLTRSLGKRGLDGAAFQEADTLEEVRALAAMSKADLRQYERLYEQRAALAGSAGRTYAEAVGAKSSDIRELQREVKGLRKDVRIAEKRAEKSRDKNGDKTRDGMSASARAAARRRRRNQD